MTVDTTPESAVVPSDATEAGKSPEAPSRRAVEKTYKLYIGGAFPRTESGRSERFEGADGTVAHVCRASRKDLREAVLKARAAQAGWAGRSAYNRCQILYRVAEMLEGRSAQFTAERVAEGAAPEAAEAEVAAAVDRLIYFAGWADKFQQVFSSVNPVASSHFNFSILEPTGVVGIVAPPAGLIGLVSQIAPALVAGNTVVTITGEDSPLSAISFAEVLHTSDVPGGVVNLLTGRRDELLPHLGGHHEVNAIVAADCSSEQRRVLEEESVHNLKRTVFRGASGASGAPGALAWQNTSFENPYLILDTTETKTTWHPIGT